jgi:hypothetical protein
MEKKFNDRGECGNWDNYQKSLGLRAYSTNIHGEEFAIEPNKPLCI